VPLDGCYLLGKLYVAITYFFMTFMMTCYGYEIETQLVVRWLKVELMRVFKVLSGQCYVRSEPWLWLIIIVWIARPCVACSAKLNY